MPVSIQDQKRKEYKKGIQCHFCIDQFSDDDRKRFEERQKQIDRLKVENQKNTKTNFQNHESWKLRKISKHNWIIN